MKWLLILTHFLLWKSEIYANPLPVYPAEVVARDLISSLDFFKEFGHIGVTTAPNIWQDAFQVIEVLNNDNNQAIPVIQTNWMLDFKSRSAYWGSRYGIADRGNNALKILREANFQKDMGCASYTLNAIYYPSRGGYDSLGRPQATYCGRFRCDTFINYIFHWGGYNLPNYSPPGENNSFVTPKRVFMAFPLGNGDGPHALQCGSSHKKIDSLNQLSIHQLNKMPMHDFHHFVNNQDKSDLNQNLELAKNNLLAPKKRTLIIDKLGFSANKNHILDLIEIYKKENLQNIEIKQQILSSTQNLYQRYFYNHESPEEKLMLINFYKQLIHDNHLEAYQAQIATRGFISLSNSAYIKEELNAINQQISKLHPKFQLGLEIELVNKSQDFEKIYIPQIIELLKTHQSAELDDSFNLFMINRLTHAGINDLLPESKQQIATYLASIQDKYTTFEAIPSDPQITMFSWGKWLEATALMNSDTFEKAGKWINQFLVNKSNQDQINYVIGLSSSDYLKKAFMQEPVLLEFKNNNLNWYENSVGLKNEHP